MAMNRSETAASEASPGRPLGPYACAFCGWSGHDLRWSAVADGFGRHAGECPSCARRFKRCYVSATHLRRCAAELRAARAATACATQSSPPA